MSRLRCARHQGYAGIDDGLQTASLRPASPSLPRPRSRHDESVSDASRLRRLRVLRALERPRTAHDRVGEIDRDVATRSTDAASLRGLTIATLVLLSSRRRDLVCIGDYGCAYVGRRFGREAVELQHRSEHPPDLPAGRVSPYGRTTPLNSAGVLHSHEAAGGLGEGDIGRITSGVSWRGRKASLRTSSAAASPRAPRPRWRNRIRARVHHDVRLARLREHRLHVHAAGLRKRNGEVGADRVCRLGQKAERRAGRLGNQLGDRVKLRNSACWVA